MKKESNPKLHTRFLQSINQLWQHGISWLFPKKTTIPPISDDASSRLMAVMKPISFFDKLSHAWVNQSIWAKGAFMVGVGLFFGVMGLFIDAPLLCGLAAGFITGLLHVIFTSHEKKRLLRAHAQMKETVELNQELQRNKNFFEEATRSMNLAASATKEQAQSLETEAHALHKESQSLQEKDALLSQDIESIHQETATLTAAEKKVTTSLSAMDEKLHTCSNNLSQTKQNLTQLDASTAQFTKIVSECDQSQQQLTKAVHQLSLFVNQPKHTCAQLKRKPQHQALIDKLRTENDADDALIQEMKRQRGFGHFSLC